jgi:ribosomal protein L30, bacterial/organelle
MEKVKVVLTKSLIGSKPKQRATAKSLGLNRIGDSIIHNDDPVLAGKVKILSHLVSVEKA